MDFKGLVTLDEFIFQRQKDFPFATGELSGLLRDIGLASKIISREVNKAGLTSILGSLDSVNVQGEGQKKLDVLADDLMIKCLRNSGECCGIASEENDTFVDFGVEHQDAHYVVLFDPLDGSSNIDYNISIGTIFSIYRRVSPVNGPVTKEDFLQAGTEQVAAGYVLYGSSTMMVYTTGNGVNGFTLDQSLGEFCLSHKNIKMPAFANTYSMNQGSLNKFPESVKKYVEYCSEEDKTTKRPYSLRYVGTMVSDVHRNLLKGGIFIYPATTSSPKGKLRLMYECNPMSFLAEQAGGISTTGSERIMEIQPTELHQRVPIAIGSKDMVNKFLEY